MFDTLHLDDVVFFSQVVEAMRKVARDYQLPLRSVTPYPMPQSSMADRLGDCNASGDIRLVMRCTVDGVWCDAPMSPSEVWNTAAHELAHLRHMNHGEAFETFRLELQNAIDNTQESHREKLIKKIVKLQAARDGEAALNNTEAAEAFAGAINRLLIDHELNASDLDFARGADNDPVIELPVDMSRYNIERKHARSAWEETLARVVAKAHLCTFLLRPGSNQIWFVGTKSHALVAEYAYGTLVRATATMSDSAYKKFRAEIAPIPGTQKRPGTYGFTEAWIASFLQRINEKFEEARKASVAEAPEGTSVALVRLSGALVKVNAYIDNKFKSRRSSAAVLNRLNANHAEGSKRGRAAADALGIGRKAVTSTARKQLT